MTTNEPSRPDAQIELDCPKCGALCLVNDGSYVAISTLPAAATPVEKPAAAPADERAAHVVAIPAGYALVPKRITAAMIESAMEHHYGKRRAQQNGGAGGIVMTVNDTDWSGIDAMRRFWKGALAAAPQPPAQADAREAPRYREWRHLRERGEWSNGVPDWAAGPRRSRERPHRSLRSDRRTSCSLRSGGHAR
ncbi:hypothetical protein LFL97_09435 [Burkholderia sp. JSH-S8]|nr:hypothetical protein LFL97_09435 [Burkholderia sp. JSH-S8]